MCVSVYTNLGDNFIFCYHVLSTVYILIVVFYKQHYNRQEFCSASNFKFEISIKDKRRQKFLDFQCYPKQSQVLYFIPHVLLGREFCTWRTFNLITKISRQKFHHSLKEHHKISNIPKFRCEML
jgi:hypothetical protein